MSAKRLATSDLNHENWDKEEEPEERGTFRAATEEEMKGRIIKRARRRANPIDGDGEDASGDTAKKSIFSQFSGFSNLTKQPAATTSASSPFEFLSKIPSVKATQAQTSATSIFGASTSTTTIATTAAPKFSFGGNVTTTMAKIAPKDPEPAASSTSTATLGLGSLAANKKSGTYCEKLRQLNEQAAAYIKSCVEKNPHCILTPIFRDYEKHLNDIECEENAKKPSTIPTTTAAESSATNKASVPAVVSTPSTTFAGFQFSSTPTTQPSVSTGFKFGFSNNNTNTISTSSTSSSGASSTNATQSAGIFSNRAATTTAAASETPKTNGFSFTAKNDAKDTPNAALTSTIFSFGKPAAASDTKITTDEKKLPTTSGFSFTPSAAMPFSFGNVKSPYTAAAPNAATASTSAGAQDDEHDEDEPPKVEFKQVVEEDAVYSQKCKVFVKKDNSFAERGVGTLYLKPVEESGKTQLLVRADTNLGNVLLNLILNATIPTQRMGKNNVMLICLPDPSATKPASVLLRVKTGEAADELLAAIEKHKK